MKEFEKVIGYEVVKKELEQISDILKSPEIYKKLGVSTPKGLLLHGDPGVGKTLMANCLIKASGRKVFVCRKNEPNGKFVKAIKNTFQKAIENVPSIVFLDDMDKFANEDESHRDAEEYVTVQSCIDDINGAEVFVLATANSIHNLPHSLLRAGRFDRIIEIEAPEGEDAVRIIEHYIKNKKFVADIDAKVIARMLNGHSCAKLETVINEAGLYAGFERKENITMEHFMKACMRTVFDVMQPDNDLKDGSEHFGLENAISSTAYHEAGHAVVSEILCPESVTLVCIHGGNGGTKGFTSYYNDKSIVPLKARQIQIVRSLGGQAAIEQKFGTIDVGAERDIDHAFDLTHDLVGDNCICGFSLRSPGYRESETLRAKKEQVVAAEVEKYYRKAKEILALNREFFERVAGELEQKKLLNTADIQRIRSECKIVEGIRGEI